MILYSVTVNIDPAVEQDWLEWMKQVHMPEVMATGLPESSKLLRLLTEIDNGGVTYSCQYYFPAMESYFAYQQLHSSELQQKHHDRYVNKYVAFRTLLEEV